ncbi:pyruvate formate lyase-activating protein [Candidatus Peregrinibacteria bacterium]|jgi:pyruvate formate lyase activating enzyme|nr:pyruvate formate lyase-activating protein [Candidatus Peregrinibacteria bacterium]MBT4055787.1 pyruvate formate lyase-activating protein [Candidatus Peregrinibacteria bacterium]
MAQCKNLTKTDKAKVRPINRATGMIHSFETFGALDGPGVRFVVFFEGCPLRCAYCHNRDMLDMKNYLKMSPKALIEEVHKYKAYFGKSGGVTVSGGDPVFQPKFLVEFLKLCKKEGIHVALDTSLFTSEKVIESVLPYTDLFMISLKHFDSDTHKCMTGVPNERILSNVRFLSRALSASDASNKKVAQQKRGAKSRTKIRFRYVVMPGVTDTKENLHALVEFLHEVKFELIELLPYHTYGVYKWKKLGLKYRLKDMKPPTPKSIQKIKKMLEKEGFKVLLTE